MIKSLKNRIRHAILKRLGLAVSLEYARFSYSQEGEDILLLRVAELLPKRIGTYIDIGCNHPWRYSNTACLYKAGWRGVNIDPNPEFAEIYRTQRPGDYFLNLGIADTPGELHYFKFQESCFNTFSEAKVAELAQRGIVPVGDSIAVPVRPLRAVLENIWPNGRDIDIMTVDAEGMDRSVIASHDFQLYPVAFLIVELDSVDLLSARNSLLLIELERRKFVFACKLWKSAIFIQKETFDLLLKTKTHE